jgi:hypothetical protein
VLLRKLEGTAFAQKFENFIEKVKSRWRDPNRTSPANRQQSESDFGHLRAGNCRHE